MSQKLLLAALLLCLAGTFVPAGGDEPAVPNQFFALDNAAIVNSGKDLITRADIQEMGALGYGGLAFSVGKPDRWRHLKDHVLPWLDEAGIDLTAIYLVVTIERGRYVLDPELRRVLPLLRGRGTVVWLAILSKAYESSDEEADPVVVSLVREVAGMAAEHGLHVSIYPHAGFLIETVADTVRVTRQAARANAGVTLNLCHWLRAEQGSSAEEAVRSALPLADHGDNQRRRPGRQAMDPAARSRGLQRRGICQRAQIIQLPGAGWVAGL